MIKVLVVCLGLCFIMFSSSLAFVRQVRTYHASALEAIAKTKSLQSASIAEATVLQLEAVEEAAVKKKGKRKAPEGSRYTEAVSLAHQSADGIYIRVKGEPLSLARHRNSRFGGMYNPSAKIQKNFRDVCLPILPKTPYEVPLEANLKFFFSRPKNHFRTGKNSHILRDGIGKWHDGKSGNIRYSACGLSKPN